MARTFTRAPAEPRLYSAPDPRSNRASHRPMPCANARRMTKELSFGLTDEQRMIRDTTLRMCKPFEARRREFERSVREDGRVPEDFWSALAESGLLGAFVPEAYGGTAMGLTALAVAADVMAARGFGHPLFLLT